jgi:CoA-transferase family III
VDPGPPLTEAWAGLVEDDPLAGPPPAIEILGERGHLLSRLAVEDAATICVALALMAAGNLHPSGNSRAPSLSVDRAHVAAAARSERFFHRGDSPAGVGFAPLSRFWPASDGWVRTHANYPWHRAALLSVAGTGPDVQAVGAALAGMRSVDVEEAVFAAGGVAAAVRTDSAWSAHAQGRAVAAEPLISHRMVGEARPRARDAAGPHVPATGVRVLDMTRVIAGPVCTRFLAALGADVLRLDPPSRPDLGRGQPGDTLLGKRSAVIDFEAADGTRVLAELLAGADVVVCGYRPGALDRFGLTEGELADRCPGTVVLYLSAWGHTGPWAGRRGFDSIVQAATGIALTESPAGAEPGALPCQLLDHGTGYLGAAAVLDGLRRQSRDGGTHVRRVSLARTARWLTRIPLPPAQKGFAGRAGKEDPSPWLVELAGPGGPVEVVKPPGRLGAQAIEWPVRVTGYGDDRPAWR